MRGRRLTVTIAAAFWLAACGRSAPPVDASRIQGPSPTEWLSHGRTYDEQRYSPLDRITERNVAELGLAWYHDVQAPRGAEATPLMANGALYISEPWSVVQALDAKNGKPLWRYDPKCRARRPSMPAATS